MIYKKCCICGRLVEKPYDAEPYKHGICCNACHFTIVIPSRRNRELKRRK